MRNYINSKPPSAVDLGWLYWSPPEFKKNNPDLDQVAAFLFMSRKKEIGVLYKPTLILDADKNKLLGINGNVLEEGSTPAIIKIEGGEIGSCFTIQVFEDIPENFCPEIELQPEMLKDSEWVNATKDLALIVIPTLAPLPFGKVIESTMLDDDFIEEMMKLSPKHRFWAKMMADAFIQEDSGHDTTTIVTNLSKSKATSKGHDPCCAATKGFRDAWSLSGPATNPSCIGKSHEAEQAKFKDFYYRNPMPAHPTMIEEDGNDKIELVSVCPADAASNETSTAAAASVTTNTATTISTAAAASIPVTMAGGGSTVEHPGKDFYDQLIETMKYLPAAPQHQQQNVVESREHEESVDLAKLQISMLKLMHASGKIDWDECTVKDITLNTLAQGFKNLLDRSATVQATRLANLFTSVFSTEVDDNDDDSNLNPLNRLLSLFVFTPKFTKAHLNPSFQNVDLELGAIYKSTFINTFQYAPQTNRTMVKAASSELEEECNKMIWRITDKDKKQITSVIEGVGQINSMEDVCMTCANMCRVMLAIVDVSKSKPLLYQFAWKIIKFIENKNKKTWMRDNRDSIAHLPMVFMAKIHQMFMHLANFSQNSLNTNKVELGDSDFDTRLVKTGVRLGTKFINKMIEHVENNLAPKEIPNFAKSLFVKQTAG
jgi:hypothetical protein